MRFKVKKNNQYSIYLTDYNNIYQVEQLKNAILKSNIHAKINVYIKHNNIYINEKSFIKQNCLAMV